MTFMLRLRGLTTWPLWQVSLEELDERYLAALLLRIE